MLHLWLSYRSKWGQRGRYIMTALIEVLTKVMKGMRAGFKYKSISGNYPRERAKGLCSSSGQWRGNLLRKMNTKIIQVLPHDFRSILIPIPNLSAYCPSSPAAREPISIPILLNLVRKSRVMVKVVKVSNVGERWTRCRKEDLPLLSSLKVVVNSLCYRRNLGKGGGKKKVMRRERRCKSKVDEENRHKRIFAVWRVCLCTLYFKPRFGYTDFFFVHSLLLLLLPLVITFLPSLSFSLLLDDKRTNEQTNERTVTLLFSRHVHLLLTSTNFLPFASFFFLLTLDRLQR
jgi:hypothetical protein